MEGIDKSFGKLAKFAIIFCKKHKLRFVFVTKREKGIHQEKELKFYENNLRQDTFESLRTCLTLACLDRHMLKFRKLGEKNVFRMIFFRI